MTRTHRRGRDILLHDDAAPQPPAPLPQEAMMAELGIVPEGRHYLFASFRYERLQDAVAYARLARARGDAVAPTPAALPAPRAPTDAERHEMVALAVFARSGRYHFREFVYDRLSDALAYARRARSRLRTARC